MERPEHGAHPDFLYDKDPNDPTDNDLDDDPDEAEDEARNLEWQIRQDELILQEESDNERGERIFSASVAELEQKLRARTTAAQAEAP